MLSYIQVKKDSEKGKILIKSTDKIRTNFLSKLAYTKMWVGPQERPKTHQTCIIYDWDDTLLCTSFLAPIPSLIKDPNTPVPTKIKDTLDHLDRSSEALLKVSKSLGKVYIITNSIEGWVQASAQRFLPRVYKELKDVIIISA
jgi:hypothetical protein